MSGSDSILTFDHLFSIVWKNESKFPPGSLGRDFSGYLSFEELINSAVSRLQKWSKLDQFVELIKTRVRGKDDKAAEELRKEGNINYTKKDLKMALMKYDESIKFSLHPSIENVSDKKKKSTYQELSLSYGNRAAVLFEMGLYDEACTDIRRAVNLGYSGQKQKLSVRYCKSLMYIHLKKNPQSSITSSVFGAVFEKTEADLAFTLDDEQRKQIVENKFDVERAAIKKSKIPQYIEVPKYTEVLRPVPEHPHILGLSNKVKFAASDKRGRYLIAGEDIYPGTLVATDPKFAATLQPEFVGEYCSACCKACKLIFVPCHQCTSAVFCNEQCRDEGFKSYHQYECSVLPLFKILQLWNTSYLTLRIIVSLGYSKLHNYVKIFEREEEAKHPSMANRGFSSAGIYDSKSYRSVYYLTDHKELRDLRYLFYTSCMAVVMTFILKNYTSFSDEENLSSEQSINKVHFNEREMLIAKLILRHLMSMEVNATGNVSHEESSGSLDVKSIGSNLQCLFSLFGHSCNPNAFVVNSHTLRSLAIIPKGTEICICYRSHFSAASKQERQAELMNGYYFTCECIACVEDWQSNDVCNIGAVSNPRFKCMFGCKNGSLNKLAPRCTKCSKGLKKDKSLYPETYLKQTNRIIYGSSSENSQFIKRDMALTTENLFTELDTQIKFILLFENSDEEFSLPLKVTREAVYNLFKGIYLFDKYGNYRSNNMLFSLRDLLRQNFHYS